LQGYSIGISSDVCEDKEKRDYYASVIADESEHLGELVNELMDLTQLESGYITLHEDDFELTEYMQEIVEKYRAANPEIEFDYIKPNDELWVKGDIRLFERVLANYLSNAIRHVDGKKYISISLESHNGYVRVSVFNAGEHIPHDKIDEIWNSFYRVDEARTRENGGHGLGLAIVKNIQNAHGMGYSVKNVDSGVEFSFDIKTGNTP
jgi:signal transduction histidine kinase